MVYLDNAATTFPKPEIVYVAMDKANRELAVNAGRGSYALAREANKLIADTKLAIRKLIHVDMTAAVVFSPSITIALNQIIHGYPWRNNVTIYLSPYEHNAVARPLHFLTKKNRVNIKLIPIKEETLEVDLEKLKYEFSKDRPDAIFCTHVSNVTGYILPIKEIFEEGKKYNSFNVLDSAQSLGLLPIDARQLDVDIIAFAGHKTLYGPLGIGGFVNVSGIELDEFITGGTGSDSLNLNMSSGIETKYEAASSNIVAVAGLKAALENLNQEKVLIHERKLTDYLIEQLSTISEIHMFLPADLKEHIGIVSFIYEGLKSEDVGMILDEDFDIAIRTGYHCAPYIHKYLNDSKCLGTVRIGLGQFSNFEDVDALIRALKELG